MKHPEKAIERFNIVLTITQRKNLTRLAALNNMSMSDYIRYCCKLNGDKI